MTHRFGTSQGAEIEKKLNGIMSQPSPGVVRWRHTFETDWSGDPAINFWGILSDEASKRENLLRSIGEFKNVVSQHVDLFNDWGLIPYFHFRSESEQAVLQDEDYA